MLNPAGQNLFVLLFYQNIFTIRSFSLKLLVIFFCAASTALAIDDPAVTNFKTCWNYSTEESFSAPPTATDEVLFLPLANGVVQALNSQNGEQLWRAELGGEITNQLIANEQIAVAASKVFNENDKAGKMTIRALSLKTGVTVWQGELPEAARLSLIFAPDVLLAAVSGVDGSGKLVALALKNGKMMWSLSFKKGFSALPIIQENRVYLATTDFQLHVIDTEKQVEENFFVLPNTIPKKILLADKRILIGDAFGNFLAYETTRGKRLWKLRLGGAVQDILRVGNGIFITSLDDFVYFHNLANGRRIWKKRLNSRPLGAAVISDKTVLLATTAENVISLFDAGSGKIAGQLILNAETNVNSAPLTTRNKIILVTSKGVQSYALLDASCG